MANQDIALMAHLMRRAGFGATREELEARAAKGYAATVEELLNPQEEALDRFEMMRYQPWTWRPGTLPGMGAAEWLWFMINTQRPLEEKMALFWHQVFATGVSKVDHYDEIQTMITLFREKGLGNYKELLLAVAQNPAMIYWLDNNENHAAAVNENWGRELLELFSMGVGNYTEVDVRECSRAFTGWTIEPKLPRGAAGPPRLALCLSPGGSRRYRKDLPGRNRQLQRRRHHRHPLPAPGHRQLHRPPPLQLLCGRRGAGAGLGRYSAGGRGCHRDPGRRLYRVRVRPPFHPAGAVQLRLFQERPLCQAQESGRKWWSAP